jgi:tight adherence protein B
MLVALIPLSAILAGAIAYIGVVTLAEPAIAAERWLRGVVLAKFKLDGLTNAQESNFLIIALAVPILTAIAGIKVIGGGSGLVLGFVLGAIGIQVCATTIRERLKAQLEEQIPGAIDGLIVLLRGGSTLDVAMAELSESQPAPVRMIFRNIDDIVQRAGRALDEACQVVADRQESIHVKLLLSALSVIASRGGNQIPPLQNMSTSLKQILRLQQKLRTASSQGKVNIIIINMGALFMLVLVGTMQPQLFKTFTSSLLGGIMGTIALILWLIGFFLMRGMVRIRV